MPVYGDFKYGQEKYGPSALDRLRLALQMDWDGDGIYDHDNLALSLESLSITRGRPYFIRKDGSGFEKLDVGKLRGTLTNTDGRFNVENEASTYYPYIPVGKLMKLMASTPGSVRTSVFTGTVEDIVPDSRTASKASISCEDGVRFLDQTASVSVRSGVRVDQIIPLALEAVNWPAQWSSHVDIGAEVKPYWWMDRENVLNALHDVVGSELGGLWLGNDGSLKFRSRYASPSVVASLTTNDFVLGSIETPRPWEVVRNSLRVNVYPPLLQTAVEVWRWQETVQLNAGESRTVWANFAYAGVSVPINNFIPPVATTDYLANANSDGSGTNRTANITVTVLSVFSGSAKLRLTNTGATSAWITLMRTRADAITVPDETFVDAEDSSSIQRYQRRTFELTSRWFQDSEVAQSLTDFMVSFLASPRLFVRGVIANNLDLQFGIDLGDAVDLYIPEKGINGTYRLAWLDHKSRDRNLRVFDTTLLFEPFFDLSGNYWQFDSAQVGISTIFAP
jgi:hypothetical protein